MFVALRLGHGEQIELRLRSEVASADAEQAYGRARLRGDPLVQQLCGGGSERSRFLSGGPHGALARIGFKILPADLYGDSFGQPTLRAQSQGCSIGKLRELC